MSVAVTIWLVGPRGNYDNDVCSSLPTDTGKQTDDCLVMCARSHSKRHSTTDSVAVTVCQMMLKLPPRTLLTQPSMIFSLYFQWSSYWLLCSCFQKCRSFSLLLGCRILTTLFAHHCILLIWLSLVDCLWFSFITLYTMLSQHLTANTYCVVKDSLSVNCGHVSLYT